MKTKLSRLLVLPMVLNFALLAFPSIVVAQPSPAADPDKIQVLIITGRHVHYWRDTTPVLKQILEDTGEFEVRITEEFRGASAQTIAEYDLLVVNYYDRGSQPQLRWGESTEQAFENFVSSGKGVVLYHLALGAFYGWEEYEQMSGGNWRENQGHHSPQHDFVVNIEDADHPITAGLNTSFQIKDDELYANLLWQNEASFQVLATAYDDHSLYTERVRQPIPGSGITQPILWTTHYGEGRVFITTLGHDEVDTAALPFAVTFARGAQWAATGEVDLPIPAEMATN